jgi:hypothetical protein
MASQVRIPFRPRSIRGSVAPHRPSRPRSSAVRSYLIGAATAFDISPSKRRHVDGLRQDQTKLAQDLRVAIGTLSARTNQH